MTTLPKFKSEEVAYNDGDKGIMATSGCNCKTLWKHVLREDWQRHKPRAQQARQEMREAGYITTNGV